MRLTYGLGIVTQQWTYKALQFCNGRGRKHYNSVMEGINTSLMDREGHHNLMMDRYREKHQILDGKGLELCEMVTLELRECEQKDSSEF